jgi:hypothetical protein
MQASGGSRPGLLVFRAVVRTAAAIVNGVMSDAVWIFSSRETSVPAAAETDGIGDGQWRAR